MSSPWKGLEETEAGAPVWTEKMNPEDGSQDVTSEGWTRLVNVQMKEKEVLDEQDFGKGSRVF